MHCLLEYTALWTASPLGLTVITGEASEEVHSTCAWEAWGTGNLANVNVSSA